MKTEAFIIFRWLECEKLAERLNLNLMTNADKLISIVDKGKFLYNAETVGEVYAFLSALEYRRVKP